MFNIKYQVILVLPSMILTHLCTSSSHPNFVTLLYGLYLTKVFPYIGVNFLREETVELHHTHTYTHESYSRMSYTLYDTRKAWNYRISYSDIWIYSRKSLIVYLPKVCWDPTGIPYDDQDDKVKANEVGLSDIPLPLDDTLANAHAPHSAC